MEGSGEDDYGISVYICWGLHWYAPRLVHDELVTDAPGS